LDIQAIEVLIESLQSYEGSFVLVSHDRYFISRVANKIWYIEDRELKEYPGTYDEYHEWHERQLASKAEVNTAKPKKEKKDWKKENKPVDQNKKKDIQKLKNQLNKIEMTMNKLAEKLADLEGKLASPEVLADPESLISFSNEHQTVQTELNATEADYEGVMEKLIDIED
jgi:ATP-binding cassette subfamily F protein 3